MPDRPRTGVRAGILIALLVLVGGGCGSTASPNPTATPSPTPTPTATATATPVATPTPTPTGSTGATGSIGLEPSITGTSAPVDLAASPDGSGRLFIAEQGGLVRLVDDGVLADLPYLDLSDRVSTGGERGLLGIAPHPDFPDDPRLFVDYTDSDGNTVVASFDASLDAAAADPESEHVILRVTQPFPNHNGGALAFGPDGMLYIALGDGGSGGDPQGNGQRLDTHLAKILRVDIDVPADQQPAYDIPVDNPWADGANGALPEDWLMGLRNPWRIRFDQATGDLWIGDVGQGAWEEIDVVRNGSPGGANFGWNVMEGFHCYEADTCDKTGLTFPVAEYGHDVGCAVVGGVVVRDPTRPTIDGRYLFADDCSGRIWSINAASDGPQKPVLEMDSGRTISAISEDGTGQVYVLDLGSGEILRVTAEGR